MQHVLGSLVLDRGPALTIWLAVGSQLASSSSNVAMYWVPATKSAT